MPHALPRAARLRALFPLLLAAAALTACGATAEQAAAGDSATARAAASVARPADPRLARADSARIQGNPAASVWLIEVSDFECPYCRVWHDRTYETVRREYIETGKVRMAYVNFPLTQHRHARDAAEAALCAGEQGRFWEMHDALFSSQEQWTRLASSDSAFLALAEHVGVDMTRHRECLASDVMLPLVEADMERARAAGVQSTPTFIIGDERIEGAAPIERFRSVLDAALAGQGTAPAPAP